MSSDAATLVAVRDDRDREIRKGDGVAVDDFEIWYATARPRLLLAVRGLGVTPEEAQEVADEALALAFERWTEVSAMANPTGWAYGAAKNRLRNQIRRSLLAEKFAQLRRREVEPIDDAFVEFRSILAGLTDRQRHLVIMRHVLQMTEPEIAAELGITRGTVSSRLRTAHEQIRRTMLVVVAGAAIWSAT
jgi:RNA polymerase sigma-70 factor (ECF subfamily)